MRFSAYEWKTAEDGILYLTPAKTDIYDLPTECQRIVLDVIDIGRMGTAKKSDTEIQKAIRLCKHRTKAFVASRPSAVFCSPQCKNKYNVYKSRNKNKD